MFTWIRRMQRSQLDKTIKRSVPVSPWQSIQTSSILTFEGHAGSTFANILDVFF
jgi:hypothetical protein